MFYGISGGSIIIHRNGDMDAAREMALKIAKDIKKRKSVKGAQGSLELLDEMRNRVA
jgi:hypothetical protein